MSDVKRLLEEATPRPWGTWTDGFYSGVVSEADGYQEDKDRYRPLIFGGEPHEGYIDTNNPDALLAIYAVNRLPLYEAAVEALDRIQQRMSDWQDATQKAGVYRESDPDQQMAKWVFDEAFKALARLRGKGPV